MRRPGNRVDDVAEWSLGGDVDRLAVRRNLDHGRVKPQNVVPFENVFFESLFFDAEWLPPAFLVRPQVMTEKAKNGNE